MQLIQEDIFVCLDIEATGLDPKKDRIIEIAAAKFTFTETLTTFHHLINPNTSIPIESQKIHHITDEMVANQPFIEEILPSLLEFLGDYPLVGHGLTFDIEIIQEAAKQCSISDPLKNNKIIDTLRLARLYGESPSNSLEVLRAHFNIPFEGAHRAANDVVVNIKVFKHLAKKFKTTQELLKRLEKPISMRTMPLGKHKGRFFKEIPLEYLLWAAKQSFDQDLLYSIRLEINKRKSVRNFSQAGNPFHNLT